MKKLAALALPLVLAACTNTNIPGVGQVGMSASVSNAAIDVVLETTTNSSGTVVPSSIQSTIVQPNINVAVVPSSLGVTLTGYTVTVLDSAGTQFAGINSQYTRSMSARVPGGYTCKSGTGTEDQCDYVNKIPTARTVVLNDLPLIQGNIGEALATYVFDNFGMNGLTCNTPSLKMDVTFTGYDDLNRVITPITVKGAPLITTCK